MIDANEKSISINGCPSDLIAEWGTVGSMIADSLTEEGVPFKTIKSCMQKIFDTAVTEPVKEAEDISIPDLLHKVETCIKLLDKFNSGYKAKETDDE